MQTQGLGTRSQRLPYAAPSHAVSGPCGCCCWGCRRSLRLGALCDTVQGHALLAALQQRRPHVSSGCSGGAEAGCSGVGCGWPPSDASSRPCSCACGSASSPPGASAPAVSGTELSVVQM